MKKNIAVLGVGAIGGSIGADLINAGYDVLLIDQWPEHIETIRAKGLTINLPDEKIIHVKAQAAHLCEVCALRKQFDIVFLAAKSYDSCWLTEFIKPYLKADGVIVSVQNSMNDEWIVPIVGEERDIGCALELSAEMFQPGIIKRNSRHATTNFVLGRLDGKDSPQLQAAAKILSVVGTVKISNNILGAKWTKLVLNNMLMALAAIGKIGMWQLMDNENYFAYCVMLAKESIAVGLALGYVLEPLFGLAATDFQHATIDTLRAHMAKLRADVGCEPISCVEQDLIKGRPTEVAYLNGLVAQKGEKLGVSVLWNKYVAMLMNKIEQGELTPHLSLLAKLDEKIREM